MRFGSRAFVRRAIRLVGVSGGAALVAVTLQTGSASAATFSGAVDCLDSTGLASVAGPGSAPAGSIARDPHHFTAAEVAAMEAAFAQAKLDRGVDGSDLRRQRIRIPTYFHVIREDDTREGGNLPRTLVIDQMRVLNQAFAGSGRRRPEPPYAVQVRAQGDLPRHKRALVQRSAPGYADRAPDEGSHPSGWGGEPQPLDR